MINSGVDGATVRQLTEFFRRNGYSRTPDKKRRKATPRAYKKGYEVRLIAYSGDELRTIRRLLRAAGFKLSKPFEKAGNWAQPLYGKEAVARFLGLVGHDRDK